MQGPAGCMLDDYLLIIPSGCQGPSKISRRRWYAVSCPSPRRRYPQLCSCAWGRGGGGAGGEFKQKRSVKTKAKSEVRAKCDVGYTGGLGI